MRRAQFAPAPGSLAARVIDYLTRRGGSLTALQVLHMAPLPGVNVAASLQESIDAGLLVATGHGAARCYAADPLAFVSAPMADAPHPLAAPPRIAAPGKPKRRKPAPAKPKKPVELTPADKVREKPGRKTKLPPELLNVQIDSEIPFPSLQKPRRKGHVTLFDPLLLRMKRGDSILVTAAVMGSLARSAQTFSLTRPELNATWARRSSKDGLVRFWRVT